MRRDREKEKKLGSLAGDFSSMLQRSLSGQQQLCEAAFFLLGVKLGGLSRTDVL